MPLYEYSCEQCHSIVERIQKFSDPPLLVCEKCGGTLVKLMGKPALQFKGSGFYITDYGKKGNGDSGSTGGSDSNTSSSTPVASESKPPATTPEPAASTTAAPTTAP